MNSLRFPRSRALATGLLLSAIVAPIAAAGSSDDLLRTDGIRSAHDLSTAFQRVAEDIRPSVVSIRSVNRVEVATVGRLQPFSVPFAELFGFGDGQRRRTPHPQHEILQRGLGTGFVVSEDGYVLTNHHVVADADEVTVTLWDESSHPAAIVGSDPKTDLAVLRIEADDLMPARLGDSASLRVGSWVAAMGDPFGLSSTMTAGIVSAVGRSRMGIADYEDFIQTDAAINPGNSGGPLVDLDGNVVGVNTAIASRTGGSMGIGFAIPIDMARDIADTLIEKGRVERGFLGVVIQDMDEGLAASFGRSSTEGALVGDVTEDSPARAAGIVPGDIVIGYGDARIENVDDLRMRVARTAPGTTVRIELVRDGESHVRDVEIAALEDEAAPQRDEEDSHELGFDAETLTPRMAQRLRLDADLEGVVVTRVDALGAAARAGLRRGDIILAVDGDDVRDQGDLERALGAADLHEGVRMTVQSGPSKRFVFLRTTD